MATNNFSQITNFGKINSLVPQTKTSENRNAKTSLQKNQSGGCRSIKNNPGYISNGIQIENYDSDKIRHLQVICNSDGLSNFQEFPEEDRHQ